MALPPSEDPCESPRHHSVSNREEALTKFRPVDSLLNPKALVRQARVVRKFQDIFLQGIVGTNLSADLSQELQRHVAIEQLIDDVSTVIHLEVVKVKPKLRSLSRACCISNERRGQRDAQRRPRRRDPPRSTGRAGSGG